MKTFLFFAKPQEAPEQVNTNCGIPWCCGKSTLPSDCIWVFVTGGKGISYEWRAISEPKQDQNGRFSYVCDVEFVCDFVPPITLTELKETVPEWKPLYNLRGFKAIKIPDRVVEKIRALRSVRFLRELEEEFAEKVAASQKLSSSERLKRLAFAPKHPTKDIVTIERFRRNEDVVAEVLERAAGYCEGCKHPAPFKRAINGEPYLEVHHIKWLAKGGEDTVENSVALCPNCHREAHYGKITN